MTSIIYIFIYSANGLHVYIHSCNEDAEWEPQTIGDCTGDPVILVTDYPPLVVEEAKNAEVCSL